MIEPWVRDMIENLFPGPYPQIGERWIFDSRPVEITGGQFWGEHGISNFWEFRFLDDGTLGHSYDNDRMRFHPGGR